MTSRPDGPVLAATLLEARRPVRRNGGGLKESADHPDTEIEPGFQTDRRFARVDTSYSAKPGGPTLAGIAEERGLW